MERPTLEDQIVLSKMTKDELVQLLLPHTPWEWLGFYLYLYCESLWHIIHWNWFDIWEGTEDADKYRCWVIKLKRHYFRGNKKQ